MIGRRKPQQSRRPRLPPPDLEYSFSPLSLLSWGHLVILQLVMPSVESMVF